MEDTVRNQNLNIGKVGTVMKIAPLAAMLLGLLAMLAHSFVHVRTEPAQFVGETMPFAQIP
jgi:hypothetical protein